MSRLRGFRRLAAGLVGLLLAGCSAGGADVVATQRDTSASASSSPNGTQTTNSQVASTTPQPTNPPGNPFGWKNCGQHLQCGTLRVPLDYANPAGPTIVLSMTRHLALKPKQRIGTLLVNPGGPGAPGSPLAELADRQFRQPLLDDFDILGWDPRGTGRSKPAVDCVNDLDPYVGPSSVVGNQQQHDAVVKASQDFDTACATANGDLLAHVSTRESATDINEIRKALGEDKISYFGFSAGSELGAVWATLFPDTVRAAVLDGAVDPNADAQQVSLDQAAGMDSAFNSFLAQCAGDAKCPFYNDGNPGAAFDALQKQIDATPIVVSPARTAVTNRVLFIAVADGLYNDRNWPKLQQALAQAQTGRGTGLLGLYDDYYNRGNKVSGNLLEAYTAITCLDDAGPKSVEAVDAEVPTFVAVSQRFGAEFAVHDYFCALWPVPSVPKVTVTGKGAGPIVVVGTSGDPWTPLASSKKMAAALQGGMLITVDANQHTGYTANACVQDAVDSYLTKLEIPPAGLQCSSS